MALIGDVLHRMGRMASAIRHTAGKPTFFGTILPLNTREGDNLAIHRALDEAQPGDVQRSSLMAQYVTLKNSTAWGYLSTPAR